MRLLLLLLSLVWLTLQQDSCWDDCSTLGSGCSCIASSATTESPPTTLASNSIINTISPSSSSGNGSTITNIIPVERAVLRGRRWFEQAFLKEYNRRYMLRLNTATAPFSETRKKRSTIVGSNINLSSLTKAWAISSYCSTSLMSTADQEAQIALAFRMWEEKSNLCFDRVVSNANILVGFYTTSHLGHGFNTGDIAHTSPNNYIHLRVGGSGETPVNWRKSAAFIQTSYDLVLQTAAQHEVGHLIGMPHDGTSAIMSPTYQTTIDPSALSSVDLIRLNSAYGRCIGTYNTFVDIQWTESNTVYYRTFITRGTLLWQFSNTNNRPFTGYPVLATDEITGSFSSPNAMFQVTTYPFYTYYTYQISGSNWQRFSMSTLNSGLFVFSDSGSSISSKFNIAWTSVDDAMFEAQYGIIYFFKGSSVAKVQETSADAFTLSTTTTLAAEFPPSSSCSGNSCLYQSGIDAAYQKVTSWEIYLFKGNHMWTVSQAAVLAGPPFYVTYLGQQTDAQNAQLWPYVCSAMWSCK